MTDLPAKDWQRGQWDPNGIPSKIGFQGQGTRGGEAPALVWVASGRSSYLGQ